MGLAVIGQGQGSGVQSVWEVEGTSASLAWRSVAFGSEGATLLTNMRDGAGQITLLAGHAATSPVVREFSVASTWSRIDSARQADVHASIALTPGSGGMSIPRVTLHRATGTGAAPSFALPSIPVDSGIAPVGIHLSADGTRGCAWAYNALLNRTYVRAFDATTGVVASSLDLTSESIRGSVADDDLSHVVLVGYAQTFVVDGTSATLRQNAPNLGGFYGALAGTENGEKYASGRSNGIVDIHTRQGAGYAITTSVPALTGWIPSILALSADGHTLAVGAIDGTGWPRCQVRVHDLSTPGAPVRYQQVFETLGSLPCSVTDAAVTSDGGRVAFAFTGASGDAVDEVLVLDRNASASGYVVRTSLDLAGSAFDIEFAHEGRWLAIASATAHYASGIWRGTARLFAIDSDLRATSLAVSGGTLDLTMQTLPNRWCRLLRSASLRETPVAAEQLGVYGGLWLGPFSVAGSAHSSATGTAQFSVQVPSSTWAAGTTMYFQGVTLGTRRLTADYAAAVVVN